MFESNLLRHKQGNQCKTITCSICQKSIPYIIRQKHKKTHLQTSKAHIEDLNIILNLPPFFIDPDFPDIYLTFKKYIMSYVKVFKLSTEINYQLKSFNNEEIAECFKNVYRSQTESFKLAVSISSILLHKETGELTYYVASQNNQRLFDSTHLIKTEDDFKSIYNNILEVDLQDRVTYPNTKFVYVKTTNVVFFITKIRGTPIGSGLQLPNFLLYNKGLISLVKSRKTGKPYLDNLCFFRALALFRGFDPLNLEREAKRLCKEYCALALVNYDEFVGVTLDNLELISHTFGIAINVYAQRENRETELVFRSLKQDNIMYLNLFDNHFSYITDFEKYSSRYRCGKCSTIYSHNGNYRRHLTTCNFSTREIFCNGVFRLPETIFEKLERYGINIPIPDRIFKYRIVFDCEVYLSSGDTPANTSKVEYTHRHHIASISVCSNVPNFEEPRCFILNSSAKDLVETMVKYMLKISAESATLIEQHFKEYLDQINDDILYGKFLQYMKQIPVLGFNNSKYDLKVMRDYLIPILIDLEDIKFVIKKGTQYNCIQTENLRFLDILSYLAPGYDYDHFLKAYGSNVTKGFFPYEWFNCISKLTVTEFPSYESFYSSLKSKNTLEPSIEETLSEEEVCVIGRTPTKQNKLQNQEIKQIARYRYQKIRDMFVSNGWSMKEYLEYYNNLDSFPFIQSLKNVCKYYIERGVDIFKDGISGKYFNTFFSYLFV